MRVDRRFLYLGVFLIAMGAVLVAANLYGVDDNTVRDWFRFWPIAIIAVGAMLVLRRTRLSFAGGMLAAAIPGLALGAAFVLVPNIDFGCGNGSFDTQPASYNTQGGTFDGAASVDVNLHCGTLTVDTQSGSTWSLAAGNTEGHDPIVATSATSLSIDPASNKSFGFRSGRDVWRLTLPTGNPVDLAIRVDAGQGRVNLGTANVRGLTIETNAGETRLDLSGVTLQSLNAHVNAGSGRITLPAADFTGAVSVNVGEMRVCVPADLGVRVNGSTVTMGSADYRGLVQRNGGWETPNYSSAAHKAQLTVNVNLGSFTLNPSGGC